MAGKPFAALFAISMAVSVLVLSPAVHANCKFNNFQFVDVTSATQFVASGPLKFGTTILFEDTLLPTIDSKKQIGTSGGQCGILKTPGTFACTATFDFHGKGTLDATGFYKIGQTTKVSIIGGTGKYVGATGYMKVFTYPNFTADHDAFFTTVHCK